LISEVTLSIGAIEPLKPGELGDLNEMHRSVARLLSIPRGRQKIVLCDHRGENSQGVFVDTGWDIRMMEGLRYA